MRIVVDTVVFVRALINPYNFCGRVLLTNSPNYQLFISQQIMVEALNVLSRPRIVRQFQTLPRVNMARALAILHEATIVDVAEIRPVCRDPNDDMFLATALAARADYLVTEDKDLLVLGDFEGTMIIDCAAFLRIIESGNNG